MWYPYNGILFDNKKKSSTLLKILNRITILIQQFHFRVLPKRTEFLFKDLKTYLCVHIHSSIHNSQKVGAIQVSINGWMDKQNVVCAYNETLFFLKKETDTCYNMDEPWRCTTWNKPITKGQIFHLHEVPSVVRFIETERMVVAKGWGEGDMGNYLMGTEFQFRKVKKFWRLTIGTVGVYLMTQKCIVQNG